MCLAHSRCSEKGQLSFQRWGIGVECAHGLGMRLRSRVGLGMTEKGKVRGAEGSIVDGGRQRDGLGVGMGLEMGLRDGDMDNVRKGVGVWDGVGFGAGVRERGWVWGEMSEDGKERGSCWRWNGNTLGFKMKREKVRDMGMGKGKNWR